MGLKLVQETRDGIDYYIKLQDDIKNVLDKCIEDGLNYDPLNFDTNSFDFDDLYDLISNILHDVGIYTRYLRYADEYIFFNLERLVIENLKYSCIDIEDKQISYNNIYELSWNVAHDILIQDEEWFTDESWDRNNYF